MEGEGRFFYGASIPMTKAMASEVLLAFAMNGAPLAPEHGYPLRVVVPGFAGVRSPKWLSRITVQDLPSDNHMQQRDYKMLPASVTADNVDWTKGLTINDMPINAGDLRAVVRRRIAGRRGDNPGLRDRHGARNRPSRRVIRRRQNLEPGRARSVIAMELDVLGGFRWTCRRANTN